MADGNITVDVNVLGAELIQEAAAELLVLRLQRDSLRDALVKVLDAREAEAKAYGSYQVALDNYGASHSQREGMRHTDAMVDASNAEREARVLLLTLRDAPTSRPITPVGWSDTDWLRHLETCMPIGYAVRDSLYGTSKAGVLRFCSSDEAGAFAVYASPRPTQTEPSPATPPQAANNAPLTDEQIMDLPAGVNDGSLSAMLRFARAVERAHGIGA